MGLLCSAEARSAAAAPETAFPEFEGGAFFFVFESTPTPGISGEGDGWGGAAEEAFDGVDGGAEKNESDPSGTCVFNRRSCAKTHRHTVCRQTVQK